MSRKKLKSAATAMEDAPLVQSKGPNFMDLPLELRIEIYKHLKVPRKKWGANALYPRRNTRQASRAKKEERLSDFSPRFDSSHSFPTSILLANRLIHAEASDALYRNMNWHFYASTDNEEGGRQVPAFAHLPCYNYVRRITLNLRFPSFWGVMQRFPRTDIYPICTMLSKLPLVAISVVLTQWRGLEHWPERVLNFVGPLLKLPAAPSVDWKFLERQIMCPECWHGHDQFRPEQTESRELFREKLAEMLGRSVKKEKIKRPLLDPVYAGHW